MEVREVKNVVAAEPVTCVAVALVQPEDIAENSFYCIPPEIRVLIYGKLGPTDILRMRLTNKKIKQEIDEHLSFHISLDQAFRGFRKLCRLHVDSCKIVNLTHQNLHRGALFSFPSRLKKLILDGNITQINLLKILNYCTEIEHLTFTHETLGLVNLLHAPRVDQCLRNNLTLVTHLNVQLLRYPLGDPFESENNMNAILALNLPLLKCFKLYFSLWGNYLKLLLFIQRHVKTLRELELQVGDRGDVRTTEMYLQSNSSINRNLKVFLDINLLQSLQLEKFNFRDDVLNLNESVAQILLDILQRQSELQVFQFHSPGDLSIGNLKKIVSKNTNTFSEIVVYNLKSVINPVGNNAALQLALLPLLIPPPSLVLDMSVFQRCLHLRTLALSCTTPGVHNGVDAGSIRIFNLHSIPSTIERMHLTGFHMDVQEIVNCSRNSANLKELLIADAGTMKYSIVLGCFLKNCPQLEYLNIRPVITGANGDAGWFNEVEALSKLYRRFMGVSFDPIDDLDGFEAKITESDRVWLQENVSITTTNGVVTEVGLA